MQGDPPTDGVADFMVRHEALAPAVGHHGPLHSGDDPVDGVVDLLGGDGSFPAPTRQDRRLVQEVGEVSPAEAGGPHGDHLQGDVPVELLVAGMDLQDLRPPTDVRHVDGHLRSVRHTDG